MRLATIKIDAEERLVACVNDEKLIDLKLAAQDVSRSPSFFIDMHSMIKGGEPALSLAHELISNPKNNCLININNVLFCPPLVPTQYRDCLVFEEHLKNGFAEAEKITGRRHEIPDVWYQQPIYYKGNRLSFIGNNQDVLWPNYAEYLDIELELAIIISKDGKNISKAEAPNYIFGYSILNDVSARDAQMIEMAGQLGPAKGKDFDTGNILGPYILTADEVPHPASLNMEARVNGQRWGGGNSSEMHHNFADIIAFISKSETLYSGEVIGSGTVGTGCGLEIGKRLNPNDQFELEIENIGILKNQIIKEVIDD
jgi:2-keto-4-pentenoate hydratase/2-oxohepta-3-ene-1,7-dioic acid hydratase in catechol pathway